MSQVGAGRVGSQPTRAPAHRQTKEDKVATLKNFAESPIKFLATDSGSKVQQEAIKEIVDRPIHGQDDLNDILRPLNNTAEKIMEKMNSDSPELPTPKEIKQLTDAGKLLRLMAKHPDPQTKQKIFNNPQFKALCENCCKFEEATRDTGKKAGPLGKADYINNTMLNPIELGEKFGVPRDTLERPDGSRVERSGLNFTEQQALKDLGSQMKGVRIEVSLDRPSEGPRRPAPPRRSEVDSRPSASEPRPPVDSDLRTPEVEPRTSEVDPRPPEVDPRTSEVEPRTSEVDSDLRTSEAELPAGPPMLGHIFRAVHSFLPPATPEETDAHLLAELDIEVITPREPEPEPVTPEPGIPELVTPKPEPNIPDKALDNAASEIINQLQAKNIGSVTLRGLIYKETAKVGVSGQALKDKIVQGLLNKEKEGASAGGSKKLKATINIVAKAAKDINKVNDLFKELGLNDDSLQTTEPQGGQPSSEADPSQLQGLLEEASSREASTLFDTLLKTEPSNLKDAGIGRDGNALEKESGSLFEQATSWIGNVFGNDDQSPPGSKPELPSEVISNPSAPAQKEEGGWFSNLFGGAEEPSPPTTTSEVRTPSDPEPIKEPVTTTQPTSEKSTEDKPWWQPW